MAAQRSVAYRLVTRREATAWDWGLGAQASYVGAVYAFGPPAWYSSPSLTVVKAWTPWELPISGAIILLLGLLLFTPLRKLGHFLLMLVLIGWTAALIAAVITGDTVSAGGWSYVAVVAAVHGYMLKDRRQVPPGHPPVTED